MEPEPLERQGVTSGPGPSDAGASPPALIGYAEPVRDEGRPRRGVQAVMGFLLVGALGLLLTAFSVAELGSFLPGGSSHPDPATLAFLGFLGLLCTWAGGLGLRYWYLQQKRGPLRPAASRLTQLVRNLFHPVRRG